MKRRWLVWLPFALGLVLLALFYVGLKKPQDHVIVSRMVGKPLPEFAAKAILPGQPGAATADYRQGKPRLLNVFASWCLPCVVEIPVLMRIKAMGAEVDGIAVHDTPEALQAFLAKNGNPYSRIGSDDQSRIQMALGSSGVPETFVIDGKGMIVHQHIGVVSEADVPKLLELLGQAK
jgi:cytochrome c biogenesis protein CcmG, thiol:disulfide interchange protein DsbE